MHLRSKRESAGMYQVEIQELAPAREMYYGGGYASLNK